MAKEKNWLLACLKIESELRPRQDVQFPSFSFSSEDKMEGEINGGNLQSSNFL